MNLTDYREVTELLSAHGFRFSKSMGQNFLVAAWVPENIARSADIDENTGVLEVGPGVGCLTEQLSKLAGKVVSVELDRDLKPVLAETLKDCTNVEIVFEDVLKQNISNLVSEHLSGLKPVVCANVPYNITSPLLTAFIESGCFESITVMIQKEVAQRIKAGAGSKDYSAFGIFVQWYYEAEILFDVPPSCFTPQPKVTSSVLRLRKRKTHPAAVKDEELMFRIIRTSFNQRRKTLANSLSNVMNLPKETVINAIKECGFDENVRGEKLEIADFARLADKIAEKA